MTPEMGLERLASVLAPVSLHPADYPWENTNIPRLLLIMVIAAFLTLAAEMPQRDEAQRELYFAHWPRAAELYRKILQNDPSWGAGWDSLVRVLIEAHRPTEAYEAVDEALKKAPETAGAYTAQGRAFYRQGHLAKAEASFQKATTLDPKYAYALEGLARVRGAVAQYRMAERLETAAYRAAPDDPALILEWADTLKDAAHIEALRRALNSYDPNVVEAKRVRAHIASDTAIGDRHTRTLASPYRSYELNLVDLLNGPQHSYGVGLRVRFNDSYQGILLLDTGASGMALSRKAAKKAGFEVLEQEGTDVRGIGDQKVGESFHHLAREVRIGELTLHDYPVSIFDTARDANHDGVIGADVFSKFLVQLDCPHMKLRLQPYPGLTSPPEGIQDSDDRLPAGFRRIFIIGQLLIPTFINEEPASLFVIDSGAPENVVNAETARSTTMMHGDSRTIISGLEGRVAQVSRADHVRLTFSKFHQENADMLAMNLSRQSADLGIEIGGLLGMPVLRRLVLTIDYRNAAIRLERVKR